MTRRPRGPVTRRRPRRPMNKSLFTTQIQIQILYSPSFTKRKVSLTSIVKGIHPFAPTKEHPKLTYTHLRAHAHTHICTSALARAHTHTHTHARARAHTHTHTHARSVTHTHTYKTINIDRNMGKTCNACFTAIDAATLQSVRLVKRNLQLVSVKEATTGLLPN